MQAELINIAKRVSKEIKESRGKDRVPLNESKFMNWPVDIKVENQHPLLELLQTIFIRFKLVANVHQVALRSFSHVTNKYSVDVRLYEMADVWSKIQAVVRNSFSIFFHFSFDSFCIAFVN